MAAMFGWLSAASVFASRSNPHQPVRVVGDRIGQQLDLDVVSELAVVRAIDLAHPACPDGGHDLASAGNLPPSRLKKLLRQLARVTV